MFVVVVFGLSAGLHARTYIMYMCVIHSCESLRMHCVHDIYVYIYVYSLFCACACLLPRLSV